MNSIWEFISFKYISNMNYEAEKIFSFCATNCKKVYDVLDREDLVYECAKMINIENIDKLLSRSHHVVIEDIWFKLSAFLP